MVCDCAFQPNKSTEDILIELTESALQSFNLASVTEVSFKDLQSAYDSVWHNGLYYKLKEYFGISGNFLSWIMSTSYLSNRFNRVLLGNHITPWVEHDQGLPQGGPIWPIIWSLFINDYTIKKKKNVKMCYQM